MLCKRNELRTITLKWKGNHDVDSDHVYDGCCTYLQCWTNEVPVPVSEIPLHQNLKIDVNSLNNHHCKKMIIGRKNRRGREYQSCPIYNQNTICLLQTVHNK